MKKTLLVLFSVLAASFSLATTHVISSIGNTYSPASIQILAGDTVDFSISGSHNALEVSQTTWNNNQATPLPGGFSIPFGGGTLFTVGMSQGMHYYVCTSHISSGMKGTIEVIGTVGISEIPANAWRIDIQGGRNGSALIIDVAGIDLIAAYNVTGQEITALRTRGSSPVFLHTTNISAGIYSFRFFRQGVLVETRKVLLD